MGRQQNVSPPTHCFLVFLSSIYCLYNAHCIYCNATVDIAVKALILFLIIIVDSHGLCICTRRQTDTTVVVYYIALPFL